MGPALTHVSMKYGDSGWKHVTAEEAEALFPKQSVDRYSNQKYFYAVFVGNKRF